MKTTVERAALLWEISEDNNDKRALDVAHNITRGNITTTGDHELLERYTVKNYRIRDVKDMADHLARELKKAGYMVKRTRTSFEGLGYGTLYSITGIKRV